MVFLTQLLYHGVNKQKVLARLVRDNLLNILILLDLRWK